MKIPSPTTLFSFVSRTVVETVRPRIYVERIIREDSEHKADIEAQIGGVVLALEADSFLRDVEAVGSTAAATEVCIELVPSDAQ